MYRLRFLKTLFLCFIFKSRKLLDDFDLYFIALPLIDTDLTRLFTQTYSVYMGLARWHFVFNSEFRSVALKKRWVPVTTAEFIVYKKSIKAFSKVNIRTKLLHWNDKRFYLEHIFYVDNKVHAHAYLEGLIRSPEGHLGPNEVFRILGVNQDSPLMPKELELWISSKS
jgi:hypothetical protein